jgi:TolA-binding protein
VIKSLFLPISLVLLPLALAQNADQAERLFNNAATFSGAGKYSEALADYQRIVDEYPKSPWADKALLEIGHYYLNVVQDAARATTYYERIQSQYASSASAPAAFFAKASILEANAQLVDDLDAAGADLIRMLNLYPDNAWTDGALYLLGRINAKTGDLPQALGYLQRLEFGYPNSSYTPDGLLLAAQLTQRHQGARDAVLLLARLQRNFPASSQARHSEALARSLTRFLASEVRYGLDSSFVGNAPKRYAAPSRLAASSDGTISILESKGVTLVSLKGTPPTPSGALKDVVDFARDRNGSLLFVYENRLTQLAGQPLVSLMFNGAQPRKITAAAVDVMGRIYVIDDDSRDVQVFDTLGVHQRSLGVQRPKAIAACRNGVAVVPGDASSVLFFDSRWNRVETLASGLRDIEQIAFDAMDNLYVLCERGGKVLIGDSAGRLRGSIALKSGSLPLKQADSLAVDDSGAIYLADRRGGSVFRLH